jgi:hypothetical protein
MLKAHSPMYSVANAELCHTTLLKAHNPSTTATTKVMAIVMYGVLGLSTPRPPPPPY